MVGYWQVKVHFLNVWKFFSGVGENGIEDIKAHQFFSSIDWEVRCKLFCLDVVYLHSFDPFGCISQDLLILFLINRMLYLCTTEII